MVLVPTNSTASSSYERMRTSSYFSKEFVLDRYSEVIFEFDSLSNATGPADLMGQGAGTPVISEVNTSEICAIFFDTSADSHGLLWTLPADIDETGQIDFSVAWSNSEAVGTGSCQFAVLYTPMIAGTTALSIGATALGGAVIADQADLAANVMQWSPYGYIAADTTAVIALDPGTDQLALKFNGTLTTVADASVYKLKARYYRKYL